MDALRRALDRPRAPADAAVVTPLVFYHYSVAVGLLRYEYVDPTLGRQAAVYYGVVGLLAAASVAAWRWGLVTPGAIVGPALVAWPWVIGGGSVTDELLPTASVLLVPVVAGEALLRRRERLRTLLDGRPAGRSLALGAAHFLLGFAFQLTREPSTMDVGGDAVGNVAFTLFVPFLLGLVLVAAGALPVAAWYRYRLVLPGAVLAIWAAGGLAGALAGPDTGGAMEALRPLALDPTEEYLYRVVPLSVLLVAAGGLEAGIRSLVGGGASS